MWEFEKCVTNVWNYDMYPPHSHIPGVSTKDSRRCCSTRTTHCCNGLLQTSHCTDQLQAGLLKENIQNYYYTTVNMKGNKRRHKLIFMFYVCPSHHRNIHLSYCSKFCGKIELEAVKFACYGSFSEYLKHLQPTDDNQHQETSTVNMYYI